MGTSKNRMKEKWYGISYPLPTFLQTNWAWNLWAKIMCPKGYHLFDEVQSSQSHSLFCDACEINIPLAGEMER